MVKEIRFCKFKRLVVWTKGKFGTGEGLLRYRICARCKKQASVVRSAFSGAFGVKNRLLRYGRDIRYRKRPPTVRGASSVRKLFDIAACGLNPLAQFRQSPLVNYRINSYICQKCC